MHRPRRRNVTTSTVGVKRNGHIRKNLTQNGEPQRYSWGTQKKKKKRRRRRRRRRRSHWHDLTGDIDDDLRSPVLGVDALLLSHRGGAETGRTVLPRTACLIQNMYLCRVSSAEKHLNSCGLVVSWLLPLPDWIQGQQESIAYLLHWRRTPYHETTEALLEPVS